ncbi:GntR family transcriptional regulator [Oricola sp.]|uniref:GntR family transcriptional regulator n=1 Tax=Oricola sp. TaxID=1979950 RepID=UPI0025DA5CEB|nr:GntR family transcriptional regulator [Oricola sp.]MCI5077968.1 GntR family transcriptional regulator [Oricola sp.]
MTLNQELETGLDLGVPPRQSTMGSHVFDVLRQAIIQLKLKPGNALSETEIAKQLGVSRQPVREAIIKLADAGLVEVRPQRGTYVLLISKREVETARFLREAIEVAIARKAAETVNEQAASDLRACIARQKVAGDSGVYTEFLRLDEQFHQTIARIADCESAWKVLEGLKAQMDRVRFLSIPMATPVPTLIAQHDAIAEAIIAGDPDRAEEAVRVHLREILKSLPKLSAEHPDLFVA